MRNPTGALRHTYRAAIARTVAANALLKGLEPGTPQHAQAAEELARCMRTELQAGRNYMATLDALRADGNYRRQMREGAQRRKPRTGEEPNP
jgi:hypothetical protein